MKRPLAMVALLYAGGLLLAEVFQPPLPIVFASSLSLAVVAIGFARVRSFLIWPLIVCAGWTNLVWHAAVVSPQDLRLTQGDSAEIVSVRGVLAETPSQRVLVHEELESWRTLAQVKVGGLLKRGSWQPAFGEIVVTTPGLLPEKFFAGQTVEITGVLAPPPVPLADGLFDFRTYLRRKEIYYQLKTESSNDWRVVEPVKTTAPLDDRFRAWARKALALGLPAEDESLRLEWALTLGDKTVLTDDVSEPFVRAATYHIFAVDGLRMAIIFAIFFSLLRVLGLPRAWCGLVLVPLIWFYTALTGWPASAIRATVMLTVIIIGWALKRPSDLINSLLAAALIILVWDPQQLFQAGFQLSFLVVLCIILILPAFDEFSQRLLKSDPLLPDELRPRWQRLLNLPARFVLDFLFTSLAAWLGSIPLAAYYFHIFTPVSAPANLVAVPLCALALASDFISLLLAGWFPGGAEIFNHAGWFLMECIRVTSHWFAKWPAAYYYVSAPGLFTTALYYAILLAVLTAWLFKPKWRVWKISGLVLLSVLWCVQWRHESSVTRLTALPLSGGSAVYCDAPGGKNDLLVDCGNTNSVEFVMKTFLRAHGVNELPCLALTHGDLRHVGGARLLETLFPIEQVATSSVRFNSPVYRAAVKELQKTPGRGRTVNRGDELGGWIVLHPNPDDHFPEADDNALVLRGEFAGTRVLLLSDLGRPGQDALLKRQPDLRAEIVVACLPEQGEPLSDALLQAIQPELVIITDSEFPATKRASAKLRERLERRGVPVIFTREAGAVEISLHKTRWDIRTIGGVAISGTAARRE
jgi:competence protein ComEC